jgi:hypothetical protein
MSVGLLDKVQVGVTPVKLMGSGARVRPPSPLIKTWGPTAVGPGSPGRSCPWPDLRSQEGGVLGQRIGHISLSRLVSPIDVKLLQSLHPPSPPRAQPYLLLKKSVTCDLW